MGNDLIKAADNLVNGKNSGDVKHAQRLIVVAQFYEENLDSIHYIITWKSLSVPYAFDVLYTN